jgi:hypothetical protein
VKFIGDVIGIFASGAALAAVALYRLNFATTPTRWRSWEWWPSPAHRAPTAPGASP